MVVGCVGSFGVLCYESGGGGDGCVDVVVGGVCFWGYGISGDVLVGRGVVVLELGWWGVLVLWWWWLLLIWYGLELVVRELLRLFGLGLGLCYLLLGDCLSCCCCCGIGVGGLLGFELFVFFVLMLEVKGEIIDEDGSYVCIGIDVSFGCY